MSFHLPLLLLSLILQWASKLHSPTRERGRERRWRRSKVTTSTSLTINAHLCCKASFFSKSLGSEPSPSSSLSSSSPMEKDPWVEQESGGGGGRISVEDRGGELDGREGRGNKVEDKGLWRAARLWVEQTESQLERSVEERRENSALSSHRSLRTNTVNV